MSASQYKEAPLSSHKVETLGSWLRRILGISPAATMVELGATIAGHEASVAQPSCCPPCNSRRDSRISDAQYPNAFCSKECEQQFVCSVAASLTVEDCIRIQHRLEHLIVSARQGEAWLGEGAN